VDDQGFEIRTSDPQDALVSLLSQAQTAGGEISNLGVRGANLEDVFLNLTGRSLRE
jgi:hypothetical protein